MKLFIGSDHGGWRLKQELVKYLEQQKVAYQDVGNLKFQSDDDYPDYAYKVARKVSDTADSRGLILCRSGVGACIVANKVNGIRAVKGHDLKVAKRSRHDEDTNVLCLGGDWTKGPEAKRIISAWLKEPFSKAQRHHRRVNKIRSIERKK